MAEKNWAGDNLKSQDRMELDAANQFVQNVAHTLWREAFNGNPLQPGERSLHDELQCYLVERTKIGKKYYDPETGDLKPKIEKTFLDNRFEKNLPPDAKEIIDAIKSPSPDNDYAFTDIIDAFASAFYEKGAAEAAKVLASEINRLNARTAQINR